MIAVASLLDVTIPGAPVGQARGRAGAVYTKNGPLLVNGRVIVKVHDPAKSRTWKATAQDHIRAAMDERPLFDGPLCVVVESWFACPTSEHRKREPVPARWNVGAKDVDNLAKAVLDAANGVAWVDDRSVALLLSVKLTAAQGDPPKVRMVATPLGQMRSTMTAIGDLLERVEEAL